MSKVNIDTDKINSQLVTLAGDAYTEIKNAYAYASNVKFPNDEYSWRNNIFSKIQNFLSDTEKYKNWAAGLSETFSNNLNNNLEDISLIVVDEVTATNSAVK